MYNNAIIDVSLLYNKAYFANRELSFTTKEGTVLSTGGIYTFLKMIKNIEQNYLSLNPKIFFIFDNPRMPGDEGFEIPLRQQIDPEYKANRKKKSDPSFYRGLDILYLILKSYKQGAFLVKSPGYEADDLVGPVIENFCSREEKTLLVTTDLDWASNMVHENIFWKKDNKVYDRVEFAKEHNFLPDREKLILYKAFRGDGSDNIAKGLPGVRETMLLDLINNFSSVKEILDNINSISFLPLKWKDAILENKGRLLLNEKLVSPLAIQNDVLASSIQECAFVKETVRLLFESVGFNADAFDPALVKDPVVPTSGAFFTKKKIQRV